MRQAYNKLHLWLRSKCDKLSLRQRRIFLYSVSTAYFISSILLIISLFIPSKNLDGKEELKEAEEALNNTFYNDGYSEASSLIDSLKTKKVTIQPNKLINE